MASAVFDPENIKTMIKILENNLKGLKKLLRKVKKIKKVKQEIK